MCAQKNAQNEAKFLESRASAAKPRVSDIWMRNHEALHDFKNINALTYRVSSRNTAKSAQSDFSELGHLMASVSTKRHEKSCFFSPHGPVGIGPGPFSHHPKAGARRSSSFYPQSAAQLIISPTFRVTRVTSRRPKQYVRVCVCARACGWVRALHMAAKRPRLPTTPLYCTMVAERSTAREDDCRTKLPK